MSHIVAQTRRQEEKHQLNLFSKFCLRSLGHWISFVQTLKSANMSDLPNVSKDFVGLSVLEIVQLYAIL